jgi:hypothetical protein
MEKGLPTFSQGKTPCSKSALTTFSIAIMFYQDFFYNARTRAPNNAGWLPTVVDRKKSH